MAKAFKYAKCFDNEITIYAANHPMNFNAYQILLQTASAESKQLVAEPKERYTSVPWQNIEPP